MRASDNLLKVSFPQQTIGDEERFLVLSLGDNREGVISLNNLQGVVQIDLNQVLPVPQTPSALLGIFSWRGEAIWSVDLAHLLGAKNTLISNVNETRIFATILSYNNKIIALLVKELKAVTAYNEQQKLLPITSGMLPPEAAKYVTGYFINHKATTPQFLLNLDVILEILE